MMSSSLTINSSLSQPWLFNQDASTQHYLGIYTNIERLSGTVVDIGGG